MYPSRCIRPSHVLALLLSMFIGAWAVVANGDGQTGLADLASWSDHVVVGRVLGVSSRLGTTAEHCSIVTDVSLSVSDYAKGTNVGSTLTMTCLGGEVGTEGLLVPQEARFSVGEEVAVFLRYAPEIKRFRPTTGWESKRPILDGRVGGTGLSVDEFVSRVRSGSLPVIGQQDMGVSSVLSGGESPAVTSVTPDSGGSDYGLVMTVEIRGSDFGDSQGDSGFVAFQGMFTHQVSPNIISWSDTLIECEVPRPGFAQMYVFLLTGCVKVYTDAGYWSDNSEWYCSEGKFNPLWSHGSTRWAENSMPVSYYVNMGQYECACDTCDSAAVVTAITNGFQKWEDIDSCHMDFTFAGGTTDSSEADNSRNIVAWLCQWPTGWQWAAALTWLHYDTGENNFCKLKDVDTFLNGDPTPSDTNNVPYKWTLSGYDDPSEQQFDIQEVATHEAGHWLGLIDFWGMADSYKMMGPSPCSSSECPAKRSLAHGDIAGATYIYSYESYATVNSSVIAGCPGWDGDSLIVYVNAVDASGNPIAGIPADSIYAINPQYCYNDGKAYADSATNAQGKTTVSMLQMGQGCPEGSVEIEVYIRENKLRDCPEIWFLTYDLAGDDCRVTSADSIEMQSNYVEGNCCINYDFDDTCGVEEIPVRVDIGDRNAFLAHRHHPIKVKWPNGGETWAAGTAHEIAWVDGDGNRNNSYVTLVLSKNGGSTFPDTIVKDEANDGSYTWTIPVNADSLGTYRVKAIVYDNAGGYMAHSAADTSDANFTVNWGTQVCGTISSNTMWSGAKYATCDIVVASGVTLTLAPDCVVHFSKNDSAGSGADASKCELIVQGTLTADANSGNRITLTSATGSPAANDWRGIRLRPGNSSNLVDNAIVKYAYNGIEAESTTVTVDSCVVSSFSNDGIKAVASTVTITSDSIALGTTGVAGVELTSTTTGSITGSAGNHNIITASGSGTNYGILSSGEASAGIDYTWIDGVKYGIKCTGSSGPAISHNRIMNTTSNGIQTADDAAPTIRYTTIEGFQGTGVTAIDYSNPDLEAASCGSGGNRIFTSKSFNYYVANVTEYSIMAENNWWGTSSPSSKKFYGNVDYSPVCSSDPGMSYGQPLIPEILPAPERSYVAQNYPNPFNPHTTIEYGVSKNGSPVRIVVYDIAGRVLKVLVDEPKPAGYFRAVWDGKNEQGEMIASGVYFYEVVIGDVRQAKKLVILR